MKRFLLMLTTVFAVSIASAQTDSTAKAHINRQKRTLINKSVVDSKNKVKPVDGAQIVNEANQNNAVRPSVTTPDTRTQRNTDGTVKNPGTTPDNTNTTPTGNSGNSKY